MIKIINENIDKTISYLNNTYDLCDVYIHLIEDSDVIEAPDGGKGFGVYVPKEKTIYVACDVPDSDYTVPFTLAHEFYHHIQNSAHRKMDEAEADDFAKRVMEILEIK